MLISLLVSGQGRLLSAFRVGGDGADWRAARRFVFETEVGTMPMGVKARVG